MPMQTVCVCVYIYIYIYIYIHPHTHTHILTCVCCVSGVFNSPNACNDIKPLYLYIHLSIHIKLLGSSLRSFKY